MFERITELPFVASTTGDSALSAIFSARRSRERLRETARAQLGVEPLGTVSFGRGGRMRIEPSFILPYSRVIGTAPGAAQNFSKDMQKYGLLMHTANSLQNVVLAYLQANNASVGAETTLSASVNRLLGRLMVEDQRLCEFAEEQRERWQDFSRRESRFTRLPGRLVRMDGDDALLTVWNDEASREELREVERSQLEDVGVADEGDPLILYEAEYAPGVRVSTVVPGISPDHDADLAGEDDLRKYETPLPSREDLQANDHRSMSTRSIRKHGV